MEKQRIIELEQARRDKAYVQLTKRIEANRISELEREQVKIKRRLKRVELFILGLGILAITVLMTAIAMAQPFVVVSVNGPYSLDSDQLDEVVTGSLNLLAKAKPGAFIASKLVSPNRFYRYHSLAGRVGYFRTWIRHLSRNAPYKGNRIFLVTPPIPDPNGYYTAGYSQRCPLGKTKISMINAIAARTSDGADRKPHAKVAGAHELGHHFGARHDSQGFNMMHPNAISLFDQHGHFPNFPQKAQRQFRGCRVRQKAYLAEQKGR